MKWTNLLVCLDLSEIDQYVVTHTTALAQLMPGIQRITFLHNIRFDFAAVSSTFGGKDITQLKKRISQKLSELFVPSAQNDALSYEVVVKDNNSTAQAILEEVEARQVDLIVMGKKTPMEGMGIIPQKILTIEKKNIPLLLVPALTKNSIYQVVGAIDLSKTSDQVMAAIRLFEETKEINTALIHVFKTPNTYFPYMESTTTDFTTQNTQRAQKRAAQYFSNRGEPVPDNLHFRQGFQEAKTILDFAQEQAADLLLLGRLGKTHLFGNPLGGVSQKIVRSTIDFPVCIL